MFVFRFYKYTKKHKNTVFNIRKNITDTQGNKVISTSKTRYPTKCAQISQSTSHQCDKSTGLKARSKAQQQEDRIPTDMFISNKNDLRLQPRRTQGTLQSNRSTSHDHQSSNASDDFVFRYYNHKTHTYARTHASKQGGGS